VSGPWGGAAWRVKGEKKGKKERIAERYKRGEKKRRVLLMHLGTWGVGCHPLSYSTGLKNRARGKGVIVALKNRAEKGKGVLIE